MHKNLQKYGRKTLIEKIKRFSVFSTVLEHLCCKIGKVTNFGFLLYSFLILYGIV